MILFCDFVKSLEVNTWVEAPIIFMKSTGDPHGDLAGDETMLYKK